MLGGQAVYSSFGFVFAQSFALHLVACSAGAASDDGLVFKSMGPTLPLPA